MRGRGILALTLVVAVALVPARAAASLTVGQVAPGSPPSADCVNGPVDLLNPWVGDGRSYVIPEAGTITSWSHNAADGSGQLLKLKIFRFVDTLKYVPVAHEGPVALVGGMVNTFPAHIAVNAGDILGLNDQNAGSVNNACSFVTGDAVSLFLGEDRPDGWPANFLRDGFPYRANLSAVLDPSSAFDLGAVVKNGKKGTARVTATHFANPGELAASGNGIKAAFGPNGSAQTEVTLSGSASFLIRASGKKRRSLNATGRVRVSVAIEYTPAGGSPRTEPLQLILKKRL